MALIYTPPKQCQTSISITSFLLVGFLSYSNSVMNLILYAFLSDNFKKSFLKACTCAAGKDVNAMHNENSVFPRKKVNIDRSQANRKIAAGSSRIDFDDEETERGLFSKTSTTTVTMTSRSNIMISNDHLTQRNKNDAQLTVLTQV